MYTLQNINDAELILDSLDLPVLLGFVRVCLIIISSDYFGGERKRVKIMKNSFESTCVSKILHGDLENEGLYMKLGKGITCMDHLKNTNFFPHSRSSDFMCPECYNTFHKREFRTGFVKDS